MTAPLDTVLHYHERTKHHLHRHARSLGFMDWANQPDPYRQYDGAPRLPLDRLPPTPQPTYDQLFAPNPVDARTLNRRSISRLFYDSLAISAWKQALGTSRWSLRVNPSSGCLHPTEGYLIAGPVDGLAPRPAVYHYAPYYHALEQRLVLPAEEWEKMARQLPAGSVLVGLTSIYWRESWKYGERAFRYCHHDVGHAIGAVTIAAAALGWNTRLVDTVADDDLARLLGLHEQRGIEAEHPDCLLAVFPPAKWEAGPTVPQSMRDHLERADFAGTPNRLSRDHHPWPIIDEISLATHNPPPIPSDPNHQPTEASVGSPATPPCHTRGHPPAPADRLLSARQIIRQRRSAVDMDGKTFVDRHGFYTMLARMMPTSPTALPFPVLPWRPQVSLAIFVHRVHDLAPGLYLLLRHPSHETSLRDNLRDDFSWHRPPSCPEMIDLRLLIEGDCQDAAKTISCHQDIAAQGCFSLGMLAHFDAALRQRGSCFYPRLFWETGLIGQLLYLEAEAAGIRGTGIGCFFDDVMHDLLGMRHPAWQSLYHFTVGGCVEDLRLQTLPPYVHLEDAGSAPGP